MVVRLVNSFRYTYRILAMFEFEFKSGCLMHCFEQVLESN